MKTRHIRNGFVSRIIIVLLALTIGVGLVWWLSSGRISRGEDASSMAKFLPESSTSFVAVDLRTDGAWDKVIERLHDDSRAEQLQKLEVKSGLPVGDIVDTLDGRGAIVSFKSDEGTTFGCLTGLALPDKFRAWVTSELGEATEHNGQDFWRTPEGLYLGIHDSWAMLAIDESSAEYLLATIQGRQANLESSPRFTKALGEMPEQPCQVIGYFDIQTVVADCEKSELAKSAGFDSVGFKQLSELDYAIGQFSLETRQAHGLLAVSSTEGELAKKLTAKGGLDRATLKHFSKDTSFLSGVDVKWLVDLGVAAGQLNSNTRTKAAMIPLGLMALGNPFNIFEGEIWAGTDALDKLGELEQILQGSAPPLPSVKAVVPVRDEKLARTFMNERLSPLTSLMAEVELDKDVLTISYGSEAKKLGPDAGSLGSDSEVKALMNWGQDSIIYFDVTNMDGMLDSLLAAQQTGKGSLPPDVVKELEDYKYSGDVRGYSCIRTGPEGIRLQMRGQAGGLPMFTAVLSAAMIPNFVKSRSRGQLTACKSNLKNLAVGCDMWATDHDGEYPTNLKQLTPEYLRNFPECPSAGKDTYSESYKIGGPRNPYSFYCSGHHHGGANIGANFPRFDDLHGLTER